MSENKPTSDDLRRLQGRVVALETICSLMISVFAKKPSLQSDFVRILTEFADKSAIAEDNPIFNEGMKKGFKSVVSKICTDEGV